MGTGLSALGEKQVNFSLDGSSDGLAGTQADPAVAALSNGNFVVVYENPETGDSLLAHFFDASGNAIGPPVSSGLLNGVLDIDPAAHVSVDPAVAATPNGGFLVAYVDTSVTAQNPVTKVPFEANGIDVRRYDNTTGLSASFVIDTGGGPLHQPNVGTVDDVAIAAFADGTSLVAWDFDFNADPTDDDVYFAFLNSSASGFTTVNGTALDQRPLTIANGFEGEPSVASSGNLAAVVYAADPGHKQGDQDIILTAFNSSGTQLVPPTTIFGASSLDVFSHPAVAALSDGRFVIAAQDDTTSTLLLGIYDLATHAATPLSIEFPDGTDPHVVSMPGGGFFLSYDYTTTGDVAEADFGPDGSFLSAPGFANSYTTGLQDENAVGANASGTVFVAWQDASASNPNSTDRDTRIEAQAFQAPPPAPSATNFSVLDTTTNTSLVENGTPYSGPVAGLQWQFIDPTTDNLNVTANVPNVFIHTGSGEDAIDISHANGANVLDGSTGSNFLVGGTGGDTFFVDDRGPSTDIWSTVSHFHAGDSATIFGITQSGFDTSWVNGQGAVGFAGLTLHVTAAGHPTASLTLAGFSTADMSDGRITTSFGQEADGTPYFYVHANS